MSQGQWIRDDGVSNKSSFVQSKIGVEAADSLKKKFH